MYTFHNVFSSSIFFHVRAVLDCFAPAASVSIVIHNDCSYLNNIFNYFYIDNILSLHSLIIHKNSTQKIKSTVVILPFVFHMLKPEEEPILIDIMNTFLYTVIIDFRVPERNLDIPFFWLNYAGFFCRAGEKYRNFQSFIQRNAIEGVITNYSLNSICRKTVCAGTASLILTKNISC